MNTASDHRDPETYAVIGAAMEVHKELGSGFAREVYLDALEVEFGLREIPFVRNPPIMIHYKEVPLGAPLQVDFVCFDEVMLELKAVRELPEEDSSRVLQHLRATGLRRALLMNFGALRLDYKRLVIGGGKPESFSAT